MLTLQLPPPVLVRLAIGVADLVAGHGSSVRRAAMRWLRAPAGQGSRANNIIT